MQDKKRVLICDDDSAILDVCKLILNQDYQVETVATCDNIIEAITKINPNIILMDIRMPGEGDKAATLIHQTKEIKHIPVIVFSALFNIEEIGKKVNATAILEKPFGINVLLETIKKNIL